jgi:hypothetical protein
MAAGEVELIRGLAEDQVEALELMKHPRSVVTFSDSGAHVSQIMDSSLQTHLLSHWVRDKQAFTLEEAVKMITSDTAPSSASMIAVCCARAWRPTSSCSIRRRSVRACPRWCATCRRQAAAPEGRRHAGHDRERPGAAARQRADRQPAGQARAQGRAAR